MDQREIVNFIWDVANLIRDTFKRGKYQDVILPLTILRRLDCVLAITKQEVRKRAKVLQGRGIENLDPQLRAYSGFAFYNTSAFDFDRLTADALSIASNLRNYIAGFSDNMLEVLDKFNFDNTIDKLEEADLLFKVIEQFKKIDLHPDKVDNATMGMIFEELIRRFNEALNENPGEHFTPRDVVHLMVDLMLAGDEDCLSDQKPIRTIYDPCCGSGGMLMIAKEHITIGRLENGNLIYDPINPEAEIHLFGQEVNPETWAISKSDMFIKDPSGSDADNISFGSILSDPGHKGQTFDYMIANPPYGKDWRADENVVRDEHRQGRAGRFGPGLPRKNDGQLLFLLHMLSHLKDPEQGGSRIAIIMNGSPLFTGDAGSGESEIRRYVFENDLLEALIALPEQLFYNTGIATYIWLLSNRKSSERQGRVQLIDATSFWTPLRKSLGNKRRQISPAQAEDILKILTDYQDDDTRIITKATRREEHVVSRIVPTTHFGFRKITVERPLRRNYQASLERIGKLRELRKFSNLNRNLQMSVIRVINGLSKEVFIDREEFKQTINAVAKRLNIELPTSANNMILSGLAKLDMNAMICRKRNGQAEPDSELRDYEHIPLSENVYEFFEREVRPLFSDAWINESNRGQDGEVGIIGYSINFKRLFSYHCTPSRSIEEIQSHIQKLVKNITELLDLQNWKDHNPQNIPEHWEERRLASAISAIESGKREQGDFDNIDGIPNLGGEHIGNNKLLTEHMRYISQSFYESLHKGKIKENDILLVKDGATIGKVSLIREMPYERCSVNEHVYIIRSSETCLSTFLFYLFASSKIQDNIWLEVTGAAQPGLNKQFSKQIMISIPPLKEQKDISDLLDKETARLDNLIEMTEEAVGLLKELRSTLISDAVMGKIAVRETLHNQSQEFT